MTKFSDGDIIEYIQFKNKPSGDFYTVINNGTSITGARDNDYTADDYELDENEEHFRLVEPAPGEWFEATPEEIAVFDKFGIEYEIQTKQIVRIKGGK